MTISTTKASDVFPGNGITTSFPCDWRIFDDTDILVSKVDKDTGTDSPLVLNSDFTVSGAGDQGGFIVATNVAVPSTHSLYVRRRIPYTQPTDFTNQGAFFPTMHEDAADRLEMQIQQHNDDLERSLKSNPVTGDFVAANQRITGLKDGTDAGHAATVGQVSQMVTGASSGIIPSLIVKFSDLIASAGSSLVGFLQSGVGAVSRTVQDRLRDTVHVADFGAVADYDPVADTGTDNTAAFAAAVAYLTSVGGGTLLLGRGNYLGHFTITTRYIRVVGMGRWATTIYNATNNAIFTVTNASNSVTDVSLEGVTLRNRNKAVYTSADGISIIGAVGSNSCDFLTFRGIYIFQMRNNIYIQGRTIWNLWENVACAEAILSNMSVNATDNPAQQTFIQCRFGVAGQYGILVNSAFATFPVVGWTFIGCTIERNLYNGVRITGTGAGIQAWTFTGCYFEENTYGLLANSGTAGLQKAHMFIDCPNVFGLSLNQCSMFGASAGHTDLDYHVYNNTGVMTTANGSVANCRFGVSTINDVYWPRGVQLGPNTYTSTVNIDRAAQSIDVRDFTTAATSFTPTLTFGGGSIGITYSNRVGKYVRHGNTVFFTIYIALTSKGTSTGTVAITGLPVASQPTAGHIQALCVHADQFAAGVANLQARVLPNTTQMQLNKFASGTSTATADTDFGNFSAISISGSYIAL